MSEHVPEGEPGDQPEDHDESELPHPPATATEQLDEGVASKTDEGPAQGTSPGAG
jgi:hypothetical protein